MGEYNHIQGLIDAAETKLRTETVERLTEIFSRRRLPGTRNGPITEPRELAEYVVAALGQTVE